MLWIRLTALVLITEGNGFYKLWIGMVELNSHNEMGVMKCTR